MLSYRAGVRRLRMTFGIMSVIRQEVKANYRSGKVRGDGGRVNPAFSSEEVFLDM
jgi:hypothetical protein